MVLPVAVAEAGGTQIDAAVTEDTSRPFWCGMSSQKRRWLSPGKGEGLNCLVRDVARKVVAMEPRRCKTLHLFSTSDTSRKAYLEECQRVGDGQNCDPGGDHVQTRSKLEE